MIVPKQVKLEAPKLWLPLCSSLQPYAKFFYKFVRYYMIDHNNNIDTWNTQKQVVGYIMFLKRKQRAKFTVKGCAESRYHRIFNHKTESSSDLIQSNTHKGYRMLNTTDYNYKLRSVLGQEDDSTANKWAWFNKQVCDIFLCSWMISWTLVDYTDIGRAIGCILDKIYAVSMRDSIGSTTSFFHTSMITHPGYDDHLIIYVYVNLYMKACYLHHRRNNRMKNFH